MSEANESNQEKIPLTEPKAIASDKTVDYHWRDPTKPRNPEDNVIVDGWRHGTFEKIEDEDTEAEQ